MVEGGGVPAERIAPALSILLMGEPGESPEVLAYGLLIHEDTRTRG